MGARELRPARESIAAPGAVTVALTLAAYLIAAWGFALPMSFISDDWQILARVRTASFLELWGGQDLLWSWWRPWSRELHFWTLFRGAGANEIAFHAASFALWLAVLVMFHALARRIAGARVAALACAGLAALAAWSGTLLWAAGVQDLWMLAWVLAFLHAFASRRTVLALVALAGALLSKETAAVAPALALVWAMLAERERLTAALRRIAPSVVMGAGWFLAHPTLRERLLEPERLGVEFATKSAPVLIVAAKTVLAAFNLQYLPRPETGWLAALVPALPGIAIVTALAAWAVFGRERATRNLAPPLAAARPAAFGAAWAAIAWAPLQLPWIDWHDYYGLLGAMGAWLAAATVLARTPALAVAVVLGVATLQPAQANTNVWSFSASFYQRRQAHFVGRLRSELLRIHPRLPSHARLHFTRVPHSIGLGYAWFSPAFSVWYSDSTIGGGFWSSYRPRAAGVPAAPDYFFRYDSTSGRWAEVVKGPEDIAAARAADPLWRDDHRELAALFARAEDWPATALEYAKLYAAYPDSVEFAFDAAIASEVAGDMAAAARGYAEVLASPRASDDQRSFARGYELRAGRRP